jgi:hypothetical protein
MRDLKRLKTSYRLNSGGNRSYRLRRGLLLLLCHAYASYGVASREKEVGEKIFFLLPPLYLSLLLFFLQYYFIIPT